MKALQWGLKFCYYVIIYLRRQQTNPPCYQRQNENRNVERECYHTGAETNFPKLLLPWINRARAPFTCLTNTLLLPCQTNWNRFCVPSLCHLQTWPLMPRHSLVEDHLHTCTFYCVPFVNPGIASFLHRKSQIMAGTACVLNEVDAERRYHFSGAPALAPLPWPSWHREKVCHLPFSECHGLRW